LRPAFFPEVPVERRSHHDVTLISTGEFSQAGSLVTTSRRRVAIGRAHL
jgi:hypothetical protein